MKTRWIQGVVFTFCLSVAAGAAADDRDESFRRSAHVASLEGSWRVQITIRSCQTGQPLRPPFPALATFSRGGTVMTSDSGIPPSLRGVGHGVWNYTGSGRYTAAIEAFLFNPEGAFTGRQRFRQEIALTHPDRFEAEVAAEILNAEGVRIGTGCATSAGERME